MPDFFGANTRFFLPKICLNQSKQQQTIDAEQENRISIFAPKNFHKLSNQIMSFIGHLRIVVKRAINFANEIAPVNLMVVFVAGCLLQFWKMSETKPFACRTHNNLHVSFAFFILPAQ